MRVRIVRATAALGRHYAVGEVVDLPPDVARALSAVGKAVPVPDDAPAAQAAVDPVAVKVTKQAPPVRRTR